MAKLSGLMTESSHKGIEDPMADQFGGGKEDGDPWLDGEVTTEGAEEDEGMMHTEQADEDEVAHEGKDEERAVREMIRTELRKAKQDIAEEHAVREAVRKEIRSVLRSRGVTLGGTGFGFKR
jgi:cytidylate kinase